MVWLVQPVTQPLNPTHDWEFQSLAFAAVSPMPWMIALVSNSQYGSWSAGQVTGTPQATRPPPTTGIGIGDS